MERCTYVFNVIVVSVDVATVQRIILYYLQGERKIISPFERKSQIRVRYFSFEVIIRNKGGKYSS